jgi:signal transduction histidine kinase
VAAADDERRRVVRDLHDGAQQRLVHTIITLKLARRALEQEDAAAPELVAEALQQAEAATTELRELAHGILPSSLTSGGLRRAVESLSARMPTRVEIDVSVGRLPPSVEATAYFVVAEALTNVAKHAHAQCAEVVARLVDEEPSVEVRDDGAGGVQSDGQLCARDQAERRRTSSVSNFTSACDQRGRRPGPDPRATMRPSGR